MKIVEGTEGVVLRFLHLERDVYEILMKSQGVYGKK